LIYLTCSAKFMFSRGPHRLERIEEMPGLEQFLDFDNSCQLMNILVDWFCCTYGNNVYGRSYGKYARELKGFGQPETYRPRGYS